MALNKKDEAELRASLVAAERELAMERAMRIHAPVEPDVPPPTEYGQLTKGWDVRSWGDGYRAEKACSSISNHGEGWEKTSSQRPISLCSTRKLALMAVRAEMSRRFAQILADVEREIADECDAEGR